MKKVLAIIFVLIMVMQMSTGALAVTASGGSQSAEVTGTYASKDVKTVYSVDITWEGLSFTYNEAFKGEWNTTSHTYENSTEAGWNNNKGTFLIVNHSNAAVKAIPAYQYNEGFETTGMSFSSNPLNLASAESGTAQTGTISVTPTGTLPKNTNGVIGTITITIE